MKRVSINIIKIIPFKVFLLLLTLVSLPLMQSCSKSEEPGSGSSGSSGRIDELTDYTPTESEYTVLFYGAGGGNLDEYMISHFAEALTALSDDKVQTVLEMKLSYYYQMSDVYPNLSGCNRFVVSRKGGSKSYLRKRIGDRTYDMSTAQSLEDFITWSKSVCPAKHYILIVWGHGNGWTPTLDGLTRATMSDDNIGRALSLGSLVKAVKDSGTHLSALFMDSCAMGLVETYAAYEEIADLAVASPMVTASNSGNLYDLISALRSCPSEDALMESIHSYLEKAIKVYNSVDYKSDLGVTDLRHMGELLEIIKDLSKELTGTYSSDKPAINEAVSKTRRYIKDFDFYPCDLMGLVENLAKSSDNPSFKDLLGRMQEFKALHFREARSTTLKDMGFEPFLGISLMDGYSFLNEGFPGTYDELRFDKITSWSSFLKINEQSTDSNENFYDATHY